MLTDYVCLLSAPEYKVECFQFCLFLTPVYLLLQNVVWVQAYKISAFCVIPQSSNVALLYMQWYHVPAPSVVFVQSYSELLAHHLEFPSAL